MKTLYSRGVIGRGDYELLNRAAQLGNSAAHGFETESIDRSLIDKLATFIGSRVAEHLFRGKITLQTSYQTAPLLDYRDDLRDRATALFDLVQLRLGPSRTREYKGSFSVLAEPSLATAAKIVIYESGKGSINGLDPLLADGVYVWVRVPGSPIGRTLAVAPHHDERFAYFRLADSQSLEEMADFIAACADREP